jgi:uncharacterized protein (DUF2147 family)
MIRNLLFVLLLVCAFKSHAAGPVSPLVGTWTEVDGPGIARIGPCPGTPAMLCATGLARKKAGGMAETGIVLSEVRPDGANRWRGTYHNGKQKLPATLSMARPGEVSMRVCILVLCQTAVYKRGK